MRLLIFLISLFWIISGWATPDSIILRQVENAPEAKSQEDLPKLVKKLTHNLDKEEDKAFALLAWIVKNIDYDDYKKNQIEDKMASKRSKAEIPESTDILKTRLGVCGDIAALYQKMLAEADIKATVIDGCNGEIDPRTKKCKEGTPGHSWVAVWLNGQWEFVDPTWAITGKQVNAMEDVTKKRTYEKELKKRERRAARTYQTRTDRSVNKKWFMTSPRIMAEDHQPAEEKWLLLKTRDRKNKNL